jgi:hypothetical protein
MFKRLNILNLVSRRNLTFKINFQRYLHQSSYTLLSDELRKDYCKHLGGVQVSLNSWFLLKPKSKLPNEVLEASSSIDFPNIKLICSLSNDQFVVLIKNVLEYSRQTSDFKPLIKILSRANEANQSLHKDNQILQLSPELSIRAAIIVRNSIDNVV